MREEGYATTLTTDYAINWLDKRDKKKPFCLLVHHKAPHRNFMPESKYYDLYEDAEFPYPDNFLMITLAEDRRLNHSKCPSCMI